MSDAAQAAGVKFFDWFCGIGGFRLGLERSGMTCVGSCEIGTFQRDVYATRFGTAPEFNDMLAVKAEELPGAELWCGGWPCQGLSSAGLRRGIFGDSRSNLIWPLLDLADDAERTCECGHHNTRHAPGVDDPGPHPTWCSDCKCTLFASVGPTWLLLENVPGLLSGRDYECTRAPDDFCCWKPGRYSGQPETPCLSCGRPMGDAAAGHVPRTWFGELLGALADRGWRWSWRVLDAQYFGVAQHRERVFILARRARAAGPCPDAVLSDPQGLRGNPPPRRAPREEVAGTVTAGAASSRRSHDASGAAAGHVIPVVAKSLAASHGRSTSSGDSATLLGVNVPFSISPEFGCGADLRADPVDVSPTLPTTYGASERGVRVVAFDPAQVTHPENRSRCDPDAPAPALAAGWRPHVATYSVFSEGSCAVENAAKETDVARTLDRTGGFAANQGGTVITDECARTLTTREGGRQDPSAETFVIPLDLANAQRAHGRTGAGTEGTGVGEDGQPSYTLRATSQRGVAHALGVRRLLPVECERLMALPDGWTAIDGASDAKRYESSGNSVVVHVIEWIGRRIMAAVKEKA